MFIQLYNQKTNNQLKPFYFGGSQVPVVLDLPHSSLHGGGTRENASKPKLFVLHQNGKPMVEK